MVWSADEGGRVWGGEGGGTGEKVATGTTDRASRREGAGSGAGPTQTRNGVGHNVCRPPPLSSGEELALVFAHRPSGPVLGSWRKKETK